VVVGATLLGQAGVLPESASAALNLVFLGTCGTVAGLIGAGQRRKGHWPGAATAYRVATWCFFLAALHAVKYHVAAGHEAAEERARQESEFFEQMRQLKQQQ
jgi:hypothetical protein